MGEPNSPFSQTLLPDHSQSLKKKWEKRIASLQFMVHDVLFRTILFEAIIPLSQILSSSINKKAIYLPSHSVAKGYVKGCHHSGVIFL